MTGAMYASVAGLKTHMSAMNVIGHNIANVNTNAYKASSYTFKESLYTTSRGGSDGTPTNGGVNPAQIGYGCSIGSIDMDMGSKNYSPTGRELDICIDGDGFLMVGDKTQGPFTSTDSLKSLDLERLGRLKFDAQGYLTDDQGRVVYGFAAVYDPSGDPNGTLNAKTKYAPNLTPIRIPYVNDKGFALFPTVYGGTGDNNTNAPDTAATGWVPNTDGLTPDDAGRVVDSLPTKADDGTGNGGGADGTPDPDAKRALLDSIQISPEGVISGTIKDSDQTIVIGQIAMGMVDNPEGLTHTDGRYFRALEGAGNVYAGSMGGLVDNTEVNNDNNQGGNGTDNQAPPETPEIKAAGTTRTISGGLESSGTDLAQEISNMILIQRGYQANTRIITVTDSMLEELVNMKR